MNSSAFFATLVIAAAISGRGQDSPKATDCPQYDRVVYSPPRTDWPGTIAVERPPASGSMDVTGREFHRSPHGTASYSIKEPDTTKPGPWNTDIQISGNLARPARLAVRITDHGNGGVRAQWLNEKLLWLQVWRGRIVSTDAILDIETSRLIWQQDANYNSLTLPCSMKVPVPK
jgi:hypothetical protein